MFYEKRIIIKYNGTLTDVNFVFRICVVCLAETHPVLKDKKKVVSVDYQFDGVNRLCNKVSGKGKKVGHI